MAEKEKKESKDPTTVPETKKRAHRESGKEKASKASIQIAAPGETRISPSTLPRMAVRYRNEVVPALMTRLGLKNPMEVPRLTKIVINSAIKDAVANPKVLDSFVNEVMTITGQKPVITRARKSIATFKLRKGIGIGVRVTLRRARMYEFLDRLVNVALPRVRDFRGINPNSFDGRGNYSMGIREHIIFAEINYDAVEAIRGLTVTIGTTAKNNEHARELLTELGMPFRK